MFLTSLKTSKTLVDIFLRHRPFEIMRTPAAAECLRAARALLNLSQRKAAQGASVTQKSLSLAETTENVLLETNLQLVDFYINEGIEFLGETSIGKHVVRAGARFAPPPNPDADATVKSHFRTVDFPVPFLAARALMGTEQTEVADALGIRVAVMRDLERGKPSAPFQDKLRKWYEAKGIEFVGWGDVSTGKYYGVGVRWSTGPETTE